jgi:hypothetical protein
MYLKERFAELLQRLRKRLSTFHTSRVSFGQQAFKIARTLIKKPPSLEPYSCAKVASPLYRRRARPDMAGATTQNEPLQRATVLVVSGKPPRSERALKGSVEKLWQMRRLAVERIHERKEGRIESCYECVQGLRFLLLFHWRLLVRTPPGAGRVQKY